MKKYLQVIIFILISIYFSNFSLAQVNNEKINYFQSKIIVNNDGSLDVTETITVNVRGNIFKHGIYRDLLTNKLSGNTHNQRYEIIRTEINNQPAKYFTEYKNEILRVYIGDKNVLLDPGIYNFTFTYRVFYEIAFYEDHDELFYNINGPWQVPTDVISGTISFPKNIKASDIKVTGFVGPKGSTEKFSNYNISNSEVSFVSSRKLDSGEILSIGIWYPRGVFNREAINDKSLKIDPILLYGIPTGVLILSIFIVLFLFKGNNYNSLIKNPTVTYEIPKNISPSDFRYLENLNGDNKSTTVEIVNLAIKKVLKIEKDESSRWGNNIILTLLDKTKATEDLEIKIIDSLFSQKEVLKSSNYDDSEIIFNTGQKIIKENKGKNYLNYDQAIKRSLIMFFLLVIAGFGIIFYSYKVPRLEVIGVFYILISFSAIFMVKAVSNFNKGKYGTLLFFGAIFYFIYIFLQDVEVPLQIVGLILASLIPFWGFEFKNNYDIYTEKGIELLAIVKGFKKFALSQKNYLNGVVSEIPLNFNMYETYLPYALALGVETQWSAKFAEVFKNISEEQRAEIEKYSSANIIYINRSLNNSINSYGGTGSSAFSSGGSSGGGGGGGGGGGW